MARGFGNILSSKKVLVHQSRPSNLSTFSPSAMSDNETVGGQQSIAVMTVTSQVTVKASNTQVILKTPKKEEQEECSIMIILQQQIRCARSNDIIISQLETSLNLCFLQ